jgi:hypothetical protein
MKRLATAVLFTLLLAVGTPRSIAQSPEVRHVVLVTLDGVRTQEMFGGLDVDVLSSRLESWERLHDSSAYRKYWAPTREERRRRLMPFFWGTLLSRYGWIAGDPDSGTRAHLQNVHRSSYPGYSEILTGAAHDDVITGNDMGQNPYPSVLEVVRSELALSRSKVAAFSSWSTMRRIVEHVPGSIFVNAGKEHYPHPDPAVAEVSRLQFEIPTESETTRADACTFELAMAHLRTHRPRVLYISFDETDGFAHAGRYADVLDASAQTDRRLRRLWDFLQTDPEYRGRTALIVTVDHGRGRRPEDWHLHGQDVASAENVWTAFAVPGSSARGVLRGPHTFVQAQLAATIAQLLGVDYARHQPGAAPPIAAF